MWYLYIIHLSGCARKSDLTLSLSKGPLDASVNLLVEAIVLNRAFAPMEINMVK